MKGIFIGFLIFLSYHHEVSACCGIGRVFTRVVQTATNTVGNVTREATTATGNVVRETTTVVENATRETSRVVENVVNETTQATQNVTRETSHGIHHLGKEVGNAVKEVRDIIAQAQGVNVEKTLEKIKNQIHSCRVDVDQLMKINQDIKLINSDLKLHSHLNELPQEILKRLENKMAQMENVNNISSTLFSLGLTFGINSGVNSYVLKSAGLYTAAASAIISLMNHSVAQEIQRETHKLKDCALNYQFQYDEFSKNHTELRELISRDLQWTNIHNRIIENLNKIEQLIINYSLGLIVDNSNIYTLVSQTMDLVTDAMTSFQEDYQLKTLKSVQSYLKGVENL